MNKDVFGWILDEKLSPGQHLEQGDLIRFSEEEDALHKIGVVVTADCDLENKKHGQLITLVPVLTVREILERYLFLEDCESKRDLIFKFACKELEVDASEGLDLAIPELMAKLDANSFFENSAAKVAAEFVLHRLDMISSDDYKELMKAIGTNPKGTKSFVDKIEKKGDLLLLPSLIEIGFPQDIAWVRHIWQAPIRDVAIKTSALKSARGEKVARLESPFRYRLTQKMGQVFSDIGLPKVEKQLNSEIEAVLGK